MTTLADVASYLLDDPLLAALIGERLFPVILPQGAAVPALTYQIITGNRAMTWTGPIAMVQHRVQFDAWGSYAQAQAVADQLRQRLNGYNGAAGDGEIRGAIFLTERDGYEPATKLYRRSADYSIWLNEEL